MPFSGSILERLYRWVTDRDLGIEIDLTCFVLSFIDSGWISL
jgi:hypothetical protein